MSRSSKSAGQQQKPKSTLPKMTGVWQRLNSTRILTWQNRGKLFGLAAIVTVPTAFLRAYQSLTLDFSLILFMASLYCILSLIYFCDHMDTAPKLGLGTIYTRASGRFLQLLGVTLAQALVLLPAIFGLATGVFVGSFGLNSLLYIPAGALLIISGYLLVGLSVAQYVASCEDLGIWRSLKRSWQLTKARRLKLTWQFAAILVIILAISSAVFFAVNLSSILATSWFVQGLVGAALTVVFLTWFTTYGYSIYDEIKT